MRKLTQVTLLVLFIPLLAFGDAADDEARARIKNLYGQSEIYEHFFYDLKAAILRKDAKSVAKLNKYPIRVSLATGVEYFRNEADFQANYSRIVTTEMVERVQQQTFADLFANSYGMHIGLGDIWFTGYCVDQDRENTCEKVKVKVMEFNVIHVKK